MDNSNSVAPSPEGSPSSDLQPQQPMPQTPQPAQVPPTSNPMPGQIIGANGAVSSPPTTPQPVSQPPGTQPVVGNFEVNPAQAPKKKWILLSILAVIAILIVVTVVLLSRPKNKEPDNTPSSQKTSQASSSPSSIIDAQTSSWKTYSDKLISIKYPAGWSIKQDQYVGGGNFNIIPPGDPNKRGYLGEDNFTDNAKANSAKAYWQRAYNSDNFLKVIDENSDSVNGYDTYNVEAKDTTGTTTYSIVGKGSTKIVIYYPTNDKNNDTFENIVKTLRIN